ncbi:pantoate--beta-alanine ligase [Roseomonas sp. E05]|uniref:pantoate--beta-alanine ligase n=1 Tax=Roseomonas sp. E05 TaxID=3046310 RepID=UPI0024B9F59F|nr:pantoate--beta-alanine ligase [Roseomonas sp. E05]MDJ0389814.1 pantoate--beta-alanine ligase [Roseomonas sp. E05]
MQVERELAGLQVTTQAWRAGGERIGLVPTMGALHAGHLALVEAARAAADRVIVSIFVNPLQFGPQEDLDRYPRDEAGDLEKLRRAGCDLVWLPGPAVMYPPGDATRIEPSGPAEGWEGAARPGHFRGVATVCTKLFMMTRADVAVFGEKDWQQLQVIRRVVADLHLPLRILPLPTVRDTDGLALSSRNQRLSPGERGEAARLPRALQALAGALAGGAAPQAALAREQEALTAAGFGVDYLALVVPDSLQPWPAGASGEARLIVAAQLGSVRLLDNMPVMISSRSEA